MKIVQVMGKCCSKNYMNNLSRLLIDNAFEEQALLENEKNI